MLERIKNAKIWFTVDVIVAVAAAYYLLNPLWAFIVFMGFVMFWANKAITLDYERKTGKNEL